MHIETFSRVGFGVEESVGVTAKRLRVHSSTLMFVDHVQCLFYKSGVLFFFFARCSVQLGQRLPNLVGLSRSTGTFQALDASG